MSEGNRLDLRPAESPADIDSVRQLFRDYAADVEVDLCFQGFATELANLPGDYAPPATRRSGAAPGGSSRHQR
jgi:putative acetyltransferase